MGGTYSTTQGTDVRDDDEQFVIVEALAAGMFVNPVNRQLIENAIIAEIESKVAGKEHVVVMIADILVDENDNKTGTVNMTKTLKHLEKLLKVVGFTPQSVSLLIDPDLALTFQPSARHAYLYHALMGHVCRLRGIKVDFFPPPIDPDDPYHAFYRQFYENLYSKYAALLDDNNKTMSAQIMRILEGVTPSIQQLEDTNEAHRAANVVYELNRTVDNARISPYDAEGHHLGHGHKKHYTHHEMHHGGSYGKEHRGEHHHEHKEHHHEHKEHHDKFKEHEFKKHENK